MSLSLKKVLISDEIDPKCIEILQRSGIDVVKNTKLTKEELIAEISKYDGLIVRSATKVTADVISAADNLKIIGRAGTGVDNIDCDAATKKGIIVMNTPGGNTLSAAEHTCALICALSRDIGMAAQSMKEGRWDRKKFMGSELNGKTLGIIGLGRIGKEVALRMQSFGMTTIGFDPIIPGEVSAEFGVEWLPLDQLWPQVDYITVHTPLIPQTRNLINDKVFAICKKGVCVVNCARGGIIEEAALLRALQSGQCGGAGLDVYEEEPPKDYTLARHPKVIATPHLGASTVEAQSRVAVEIAEQFVDVVKGKSLFGAINAAALSNALSEDTKPWVELGRNLGTVAKNLNGHKIEEVQVKACGPLLKNAGSYLGAAVLSGLLSKTAEQGAGDGVTLNLVNAPVLAKESGISVKSSFEKSAPSPYTSLVSVGFGNGLALSGTTSGTVSLLVEIKGRQFAAPPTLSGSILVFSGRTNSKLLPEVAGALGNAGILVDGIATSSEVEGRKWGVVNTPSPVTDLAIKSLKPLVDSVVKVTF